MATKTKNGVAGLPKRLAQIRGGSSQREFAKKVGVFQQNWNRWETGVAVPSFDALNRIRRKTGADLNWLVTGRS